MNDSTHIEAIVMRRVRRIALLRLIISAALFAFALMGIALYGIGREVWVAMVFRNGPQAFWPHLGYLLYAFLHTRFVVQALVVVAAASGIYLVYEAGRLLVSAPPATA